MNRIGYWGTIFTQENFVCFDIQRFDILTMPQCDSDPVDRVVLRPDNHTPSSSQVKGF